MGLILWNIILDFGKGFQLFPTHLPKPDCWQTAVIVIPSQLCTPYVADHGHCPHISGAAPSQIHDGVGAQHMLHGCMPGLL